MRYEWDRKGIGEMMRRSPQMRAELHRRARLGLEFVQSRAARRTGRQAESGHIEDAGTGGGIFGDRMEVRVVFDAPYSVEREFGSVHNAPEGNLSAAIPIIERG